MKLLKRLFREEEGVTLIEYGLIAAIISVALIAVLFSVQGGLQKIFNDVASALQSSGASGGGGGGTPGS